VGHIRELIQLVGERAAHHARHLPHAFSHRRGAHHRHRAHRHDKTHRHDKAGHAEVHVFATTGCGDCADDDDDDDDDDDGDDDRLPWFRLGLEAHGAVGSFDDRSIDLFGLGGLDLAVRVGSHLRLGTGQIGPTRARSDHGPLWTVGVAPYAEVFFRWGRYLEPYAQGGVSVRIPWGPRPDLIGVAPNGGTGLRLVFPHFSVGPAVRGFWVASDRYIAAGRILGHGSVLITGGVDAHVTF
jgi:hypothetical protein